MKREYRILGPLDVRVHGQAVVINAARPRALMGMLLLHPGETLAVTRLVDAVWGPAPPASADQLVRVYVSQLRRDVGDDAIVTRPQGYSLALDGAEIDAVDFRRLVDSKRYEEALGLWRGDVLADTPVEGDAAAAVRELDELRAHALEERFDLELGRGHHHELVPELERAVATQPFRERLVEQLMLALYRCGRQADALSVFKATHDRFADELGLSPGARLRQLQQDILRHEPYLDAPPPGEAPSRGRRRLWIALAAGAAALAGAGLGIFALTDSGAGQVALGPSALVEVDTPAVKPSRSVRIAGAPGSLVAAGRRLWVVDTANRTLDEVDSTRFRVQASIGLTAIPHELVYDGRTIWAANAFTGTLSRVIAGTITPPFRAEPASTGRIALAYADGSVWAGSQDGVVTRLDASTGRVVATVRRIHAPQAIAVSAGAAWVADATSVNLVRIDVAGNRIVRRIPLGNIPESVAVTARSVWALTPGDGDLWRIDPVTNSVVARIPVGSDATRVLAVGPEVWVAFASSGVLTRIDTRRNTPAATVSIGRPLGGVATDGTNLFVTTR